MSFVFFIPVLPWSTIIQYLVQFKFELRYTGGVAQMVERSLSMREVPGSIPGASKIFTVSSFEIKSHKTQNSWIQNHLLTLKHYQFWGKKLATSGNRTRAARVAGEHSTTEPTLLSIGESWERVEFPKSSFECQSNIWVGKKKNEDSQSVGFEPTLPEGIWFLVRRLNHSATTAWIKVKEFPPDQI